MMALRWRQPDPLVVVRWRGPDGMVAAGAVVTAPLPVAAIIGPPGETGPQGPQGPQGSDGPPFDIQAALIDGGTFN